MVFEGTVPEIVLAVLDVLVSLDVPFDDPAEPDTVVEWDVEGLEVVVVVVDFGAVGLPDVSWMGPPVRVVLLALSFLPSCASVLIQVAPDMLDQRLVTAKGTG